MTATGSGGAAAQDVQRPSSYAREALIACGEGRLFGPGNAQLPLPNMLMFDRITSITLDGGAHGKGRVVAELDVNPDLWFFQCHFRGDPVMPGCLGLDAMWQMVGFWLGWSGSPGKGRALGVGEVKFTGQVTDDIRLVRYEVDIRKVVRRGFAMALADGVLFADNRPIYETKDLKVGLFKPEDLARKP